MEIITVSEAEEFSQQLQQQGQQLTLNQRLAFRVVSGQLSSNPLLITKIAICRSKSSHLNQCLTVKELTYLTEFKT